MRKRAINEARGYRFANRVWLERVFGDTFFKAEVRILMFALAPIIIGSIVSFPLGFLLPFLANKAIFYGAFGIFLTTSAIWYGSVNQYMIYDSLLACFDLKDEDRQSLLRNTLGSHSDTQTHIKSGLLVLVVCVAVAAIGFWHEEITFALGGHVNAEIFCFKDFTDAGWYKSEYSLLAFGLTIMFGVWVSMPLGTAYMLMLKMPLILFRCARKPCLLLPRLVKLHFAPLTKLYTLISILWSIGVICILLLIRNNDNWFYMAGTVFLAIIGLVNFIVPQIVYIHVISGAEEYWLERAGQELVELCTPIATVPYSVKGNQDEVRVLEVGGYFLTHDRWVYPIHEAYGVAAAQIVSFIGLKSLF